MNINPTSSISAKAGRAAATPSPRIVSIDARDLRTIDMAMCSEAPPLPLSDTDISTKTTIRNGRKRKYCEAEGCTNLAIQRGHCFRHGAKAHRKVCKSEGCNNYVVRAGVCIKHSATTTKKKNAEEEPKHGKPAKRLKQVDDTSNSKVEDGAEKRGRYKKYCEAEGCTNQAIQKGLCFRHGAKAHRKVCKSEGCKSYVVRAGVCIKHGARQDLKKSAEEEPKHGNGNPAKKLKQENDTSINVDDAFLLINMSRPRAA